jgi:hypothetical protein
VLNLLKIHGYVSMSSIASVNCIGDYVYTASSQTSKIKKSMLWADEYWPRKDVQRFTINLQMFDKIVQTYKKDLFLIQGKNRDKHCIV